MCWPRTPRASLCFDRGDVGQSAIVGFARRLRANVSCGDDVNLVAQMIEGQQPVVEGEDAIRKAYVILSAIRQPLELPHHVVGEITDAAGSKWRQSRQTSWTVLPQVLAQQIHHTTLMAPHRRTFTNRQLVATRGDHGSRLRAQEGIASDLLATFDRFQQEGILLPRSDTEKRSHRRQQVRAQSFCHRNESGVTAQLQEALKVGGKHRIRRTNAKLAGIIRQAQQSPGKSQSTNTA